MPCLPASEESRLRLLSAVASFGRDPLRDPVSHQLAAGSVRPARSCRAWCHRKDQSSVEASAGEMVRPSLKRSITRGST